MIVVREITDPIEGLELQKRLQALLPQLNPAMQHLPEERLREVVQSPYCHLLVAEQQGQVVGMLTLALYPTLTARRGWVEDVVVDEGERRQGVGRILLRKAIEIAQAEEIETLSLTSSHHRKAAHALYRNEGFLAVETQPFRLRFDLSEKKIK